jgi:5,5'-dehydrodivanillate O-demethylase
MGNLLRRYWHPIAAESELATTPTRAVKLLGEDLVAYRTGAGSYGLIEPHCPHRRAGLVNGYVEHDGIRCSYHGWKFGLDGGCLHQPFEEASGGTRLRDRVSALAYRAEAKAGLVWAYLGPEPAPLIPTWEPFTYPNCFRQILLHVIDCNWLQCQENSIDPVHFEWLHGNWLAGRQGRPGSYGPAHVRLGFERWEFGFTYRRLHEGEDETSASWNTARLCIMPNLFAPSHFEWRVPIDDTSTLGVVWVFDRVPADREPYHQPVIPHWWGRSHDRSGRPITTHVLNQDVISWTGQGPVTDRTREHLGRSDRGVLLFRRQLEADLAAVERGDDPTGIVRDPERNRCIRFPGDVSDRYLTPPSAGEIRARLAGLKRLMPGSRPEDRFFLMEGQPDDVRLEWEHAMGLRSSRPQGPGGGRDG